MPQDDGPNEAIMTSVFVSYRRDDSAGETGRLADALATRFGSDQVFRDLDDIPAGSDFAGVIDQALARAETLLVVIGRGWLETRRPSGERRLDDRQDIVRLEIETALRRGIRIVPVMVQGAAIPVLDRLPESLRPMMRFQAHELSESRWNYDVGRLIETIDGGTNAVAAPTPTQRLKLALAVGTFAALAAIAVAAWLFLRPAAPPDVSGLWHLPNGSFWIVVQDDRRLTIEETHYESREVWKRGTGELVDDSVDFELDLVFQEGYHFSGHLGLAGNGSVLTGTVVRQPDGRSEPLTLTRTPPG
jgi:hypothetical protein